MHRTLTVKENLTFNAELRLPASLGPRQKAHKVNEVISQLGLIEIRHSMIGDETERGISGGQRKRSACLWCDCLADYLFAAV